jgi:hypothetical protein
MARHAEDSLRGASIAQVLDLALAVPASEAVCAKGLVAGQDGQVLDLVSAVVAAVGAVVADERAIAEQEQVGVGVEEGAAGVAAEAVNVPTVASCAVLAVLAAVIGRLSGARDAMSRRGTHTELEGLALLKNLKRRLAVADADSIGLVPTSPQPLHGYTTSSWSRGDSG